MELSIGEVARLSGVTHRTLHYYDEIGLLSPSGRTSGGYRQYGDDDVDRLQRILFYRELGFSLDRIRSILDDRSTDAAGHLRQQRSLLEARGERVRAMVGAVERALRASEEGETMSAEDKLGIFGTYGHADLVDPAVGQRFADALNAGDFEAATALVAEDATWHVEGEGELAGEYAGPAGVLDFLRRANEAGLVGKVTDVCVSDVHVVLLGAGWPSRKGEWIAHAAAGKLGETYLAV